MSSEIIGLETTLAALDAEVAKIVARAVRGMETIAEALEGWAKNEHTYQDRTGDLSGSIASYVAEVTPQAITVLLTAGMPYAEFVETAREGKWAFLLPAVENHMDDIITLLEQAMAE